MKILVYGAGAIGGYLGARLLESGQQVTMLDRPEMATLINEQGITLEESGVEVLVRPVAVSSVGEALDLNETVDLIILALKSYDLADARRELTAAPAHAATLLTVGNGIGIEEPFMAQAGTGRVVAGSLTTPVSKKDATHLVVERGDRGLTVAPTDAGQEIRPWVNLFEKAGITTTMAGDYQSMKWSKALLNIVGNATSAILDMTPAQIYSDPRLFDVEVQMLRETVAVMKKRNLDLVDLPGSPAKTLGLAVQVVPKAILRPILTRLVAGGRGEKMPSFYIDLVSGRGKSEVVFHNGAIAGFGEQVGIRTAVNRALNDILMDLTTGRQARQTYARQPDRLLEAIQGHTEQCSR